MIFLIWSIKPYHPLWAHTLSDSFVIAPLVGCAERVLGRDLFIRNNDSRTETTSVAPGIMRLRKLPSGNDARGSARAGAIRSPASRIHKRPKRSKPNDMPHTELLHLSEDVLADGIITKLSARELCALGSCSRMFRSLTVRLSFILARVHR